MIRKLADMEERIKNWIKRHLTFLYLAAITILGGGIRFFLRGYISGDMTQCLLPWMESIREAGGVAVAEAGNRKLQPTLYDHSDAAFLHSSV